jgi:hypothetical protein
MLLCKMNQQTLENSESAMQETITISISKEVRSALDDVVTFGASL